ncbi:helix-turn-helix domain-containing protein, partial [Cetobacterium sp.]|uniref:helix-turn-helix domain-containing protein n=1 Tax=Cetobacterium sp. TaxID=2071632 RepID=UPI003F3EC27A
KLLENKSIEINKIMIFYNISNSLAKKYLTNINDFLNLYFNTQLKYNKNYYYITELNSFKNISTTSYSLFNSEKIVRIDYIFVKLILERKINLIHIAEELEVSRTTIHKDIVIIKKTLKKFKLSLLSTKWKGCELVGTEDNIFIFFIEIFTRIQCLNFCENALYSNVVNPKLGIYLKQYFSSEDIISFSLFIKNVIKDLNYAPSFYQFESFKSALIYCKLFEKYTDRFNVTCSYEYSKLFNEYNFLLKKNITSENISINNFTPFIYTLCLNDPNILSMNNFYDKYINLSSFILDIENLFKLNLSQKNKYQICILLISSLFKKRNNFADCLVFNKNLLINSGKNFSELQRLIKKYYKDLFTEDTFKLYNLIKSAKEDNLVINFKQKKLLLIDRSIDLWLGIKLKRLIEQNFNLSSIDLLSYFSLVNQYSKYDYIVFINCKSIIDFHYVYEIIYLGEDFIDLKYFYFLESEGF